MKKNLKPGLILLKAIIVLSLLMGLLTVKADSSESNSTISIATGNTFNSVKALSEYDFFVGSWKISMQMRTESGDFTTLPNTAFMTAFFHKDNHTLQSIFTTSDGAFSTDLRTYDKSRKSWRIQFLNATKQRWQEMEAKLIDGKMTTIIKNGYSGIEKFDVKTEQFSVEKDQFT